MCNAFKKICCIFLSIFIGFGTLSCGSTQGGELTLSVPQNSMIINAKTTSCAANVTATANVPPTTDVSNSYIYFPPGTIAFGWARAEVLTVVFITVTFKSARLNSSTTLASPDLIGPWYIVPQATVPWAGTANRDLTFSPATAAAGGNTNKCPLFIGGLSISDTTKDLFGQVNFTVYGTYISGVNVVPVTAAAYGQFFFKGTGI